MIARKIDYINSKEMEKSYTLYFNLQQINKSVKICQKKLETETSRIKIRDPRNKPVPLFVTNL